MRKSALILIILLLVGCGGAQEIVTQEGGANIGIDDLQFDPVMETLADEMPNELDSFFAYFVTFLGQGKDLRDSFRVDVVPEGFVRLELEGGEYVQIPFEGLTHQVFVWGPGDWRSAVEGEEQQFYFELIRPSACASQALFVPIEPDECEEQEVTEYFGPFEGDLALLVTNS